MTTAVGLAALALFAAYGAVDVWQRTTGPAETAAAAQQPTLPLQPAQFRERFNALATGGGLAYRVSDVRLQPSSAQLDQWVQQFTDRTGFVAEIDKANGRIASVMYAASGDGSPRSGADMMFALGAVIRAVDPAIDKEAAGRLTLDLMSALQAQGTIQRRVNGIGYQAWMVPGQGFFAHIQPATAH